MARAARDVGVIVARPTLAKRKVPTEIAAAIKALDAAKEALAKAKTYTEWHPPPPMTVIAVLPPKLGVGPSRLRGVHRHLYGVS